MAELKYYDAASGTWKSVSVQTPPEVFIGASAPTRDQQLLWVDTDESPPAVARDINMDPWHTVGQPGEPAFGSGWSNLSGTNVAFRKLPDGRVVLKGTATCPASIGVGSSTVAFTLPVGYRPTIDNARFACLTNAGTCYIQVGTDGGVNWSGVAGYINSATYISFDTIEFDTVSVLATTSVVAQPMEPWHTVGAVGEPALQNSWVNYGAPYQLAQFRKDPTGKVSIRGLLTGGVAGTAVPGSGVAFTLPVGYRPVNRVTAGGSLGGTPGQRIDIMTTGEVVMYNVGPGLPMGLDLIEFDTDTVSAYATGALSPSYPCSITGSVGIPAGGLGAPAKMAANTVERDSYGWWNTTLARYIPQVAGRYMFTAGFSSTVVGAGTAGQALDLALMKNGARLAVSGGYARVPIPPSGYGAEITVLGLFMMNGTTDYLELWGVGSVANAGTERLEFAFIGGP